MYSKCKRMVGLLLICVLALGVSAAAFETQIEPRDNWHDYTGELPADTGDVEVSTVKKYSLQGTTQGRYLTGGVPPVRFSM